MLCNEIENENIEGVKNLLDQGVDINAKDDFGQTPLHLAVNHENVKIIELLINQGADVNGVDANGNTPIFMVSSLDKKIIKLLLEYGTDPNIKNNDGRTILDMAYEENSTDIVELLHLYGAKDIIRAGDYGRI